ncbi:molybdopterin-dependent oxidoreductase [Staphylococcus epidermidis]|nr:molybdopterin-dependent oxidoreductase [Staphylococcus epidermidis]
MLGNGRAFFPAPSGTPWTVGAAGCVVWSGVPVRDVVKALGGVADGMVYMTGNRRRSAACRPGPQDRDCSARPWLRWKTRCWPGR